MPQTSSTSISRLTLTEFRCFRTLRIDTGPESVVLTGPNGAGKTTLLEALSYLAPGSGLRQARLDDLSHRPDRGAVVGGAADPNMSGENGPGPWGVAARVRTPAGMTELGTGRHVASGGGGRERRVAQINGRAAKSLGELAAVVGFVWLTPSMDRLFLDGAAARRRFLDRIVFGVDPRHADRVAAFEKTMRERARLLRDGGGDPTWLTALEDTMARHAVATVAARLETAARLAEWCGEGAGGFPGADLEIIGQIESWLDDVPALMVEDRVREALNESRRRDMEVGSTAIGSHRSDLRVRLKRSGRPAAECSTGEQKTLLVALVLAAARLQGQDRGTLPLMLLDEVAAHLDARHRGALFEEIDAIGAQAWYTGTERAAFAPLRGRVQDIEISGTHTATLQSDERVNGK